MAGKATQFGGREVPAAWASRHRSCSHQDGLVLAERLAADAEIPWADVVLVASLLCVSMSEPLLKASADELYDDARWRLGCWTCPAVEDIYAPEFGGR